MLEIIKEIKKFELLLERCKERIEKCEGIQLEVWKSKRDDYERKLIKLRRDYKKFGGRI